MTRKILLLAAIAGMVLVSCKINEEDILPRQELKKSYLISPVWDFVTSEFKIMRYEQDGSGATQLFSKVIPNYNADAVPDLSADGKKLVYASGDSLYLVDIASGVSTFIYKHENSSIRYPALNANGSKIAFAARENSQGGGSNLFIVNAEAGAVAVKITNYVSPWWAGTNPSFSSNGQRIAYSVGFNADDAIYISDIDGNNTIRVSETHAFGNADGYPAFSNDMNKIVFTSSRYSGYNGPFDLVVADVTAGAETNGIRLTALADINKNFARNPAFSLDGKAIYFCCTNFNTDNIYNLYKVPVTGGVPVALTNNTNSDYIYLAVYEIEYTVN